MNIFNYWSQEATMSTMRRQQAEIARLRRRSDVGDTVVLAACLAIALVIIFGRG